MSHKPYVAHEPTETGEQFRQRVEQLRESGKLAELQAAAEARQLQPYKPEFTGNPDAAIFAYDLQADSGNHCDARRGHGGRSGSKTRSRKKKKGTRVCGCGLTQCEHLRAARGRKPLPEEKRGVSLTVWLPPDVAAQARATGNASKYVAAALRGAQGGAV